MFLAIINDTYAVVKAESMNKKVDFQMSDFFKTGVNNVRGTLGVQDRYGKKYHKLIRLKWIISLHITNSSSAVAKILVRQTFVHEFILRYRGVDVENAIKLAAADDGFVTYDELRENLRKLVSLISLFIVFIFQNKILLLVFVKLIYCFTFYYI